VIARRYRTPSGEIDLIGRRRGLLVFVEVKARAAATAGAETVSDQSRRRIVAAADQFMARNRRLAGFDRRFDIALVTPWRLPRFLTGAFDADA
jgi:putative endonuclease